MKKSKQTVQEFTESYIVELKGTIDKLDVSRMELAIDMLMEAYKRERKIFIVGNGGAASTASHMACDLGKGTLSRVYDKNEKRLRVMSLTDNVSLLTAFANDVSFNEVFVQQLRNLVEADDLIIFLSGSGNSPNMINAAKYAKECGAKTIGLLGFKTGGKLAKLVDCSIIVQSEHYGIIEDVHLMLNHIITSWLAKIKNEDKNNQPSTNKATPFKS